MHWFRHVTTARPSAASPAASLIDRSDRSNDRPRRDRGRRKAGAPAGSLARAL